MILDGQFLVLDLSLQGFDGGDNVRIRHVWLSMKAPIDTIPVNIPAIDRGKHSSSECRLLRRERDSRDREKERVNHFIP